jgi:sec-independent protein translocase protein TatB
MFDIGWSEMALVLLVALIVIGPKDLPRVARTMGQWVGKGRAMARELQRALEDMAREAELDKVKSEIEKAGRTNVGKTIEKTIDPSGELSKAFDPKADGKGVGSGKRASGDQPASADAQPAQAASAPAAPAKPPESQTPAGNGAGVAEARKKPARKTASAAPVKPARESAPAAPVKRKRRAPAGNGAGPADDPNEPARETAPAEPN